MSRDRLPVGATVVTVAFRMWVWPAWRSRLRGKAGKLPRLLPSSALAARAASLMRAMTSPPRRTASSES